jgi:hypothetical protein
LKDSHFHFICQRLALHSIWAANRLGNNNFRQQSSPQSQKSLILAPSKKHTRHGRQHQSPFGEGNRRKTTVTITILLAKYAFGGGSFTTRQRVDEITRRNWRNYNNDKVKARNVTAVLGVTDDFVRVSTKGKEHQYRVADKHLKASKL